MATLRVVLNRALTAIREATVDPAAMTVVDSLQLMLLEFINEIKEEIESAHNWRALRQSLTVTLLANTSSVSIPGTNERSRVVRAQSYESGQFVPLVFDVTAPSGPIALVEMPLNQLQWRLSAEASNTTTQPSFFAMDTAAGLSKIWVYPMPNTPRNLQLYMTVPQASLAATDLDTSILIPEAPLVKGTIWYAREERGEELGPQGAFTEERYRTSLDDRINEDATNQGESYDLMAN